MPEDADAAGSVSRWSYLLLVLGSAAYFCFLFSWILLPAFLDPVIADLGLSNTQAGAVAGAVPLVYVPLGLVSGLVIDRVGAARAIGLGLLLVGAGQALRAGATGFLSLLWPTLLLGVGGMGLTFGLPKLVSDLFPSGRLSSVSSVYVVGASLGTAAAFGLGRPVLGPLLGGWEGTFRWTGLAIAGYALAWLAVSWVLWPRVETFSTPTGEQDRGFSLSSARTDVTTVLSHPALRLLVVVGTMRLFVTHGMQSWLPTVLEARGLTATLAATVASLLVVARIGGTLTLPPLADRFAARRRTVIGCGALVAVGTAAVVVLGASAWATVAAVALVGIGLGGLGPLVRALPTEFDEIGPGLTATANGLIFTVGEIGGFGGPVLVGGLRDLSGSFWPGFALLALGGVVIVVAGSAMVEPAT